jgi:hypothetical protein
MYHIIYEKSHRLEHHLFYTHKNPTMICTLKTNMSMSFFVTISEFCNPKDYTFIKTGKWQLVTMMITLETSTP